LELSFRSIEEDFTKLVLDSGSSKVDLKEFSNKWKGLRSTYGDLVWGARDAAGKAYTVANDFQENMVDFIYDGDEVADPAEKQGVIDKYLKGTAQKPESVERIQVFFDEFNKEMTAFQKSWDTAVQKELNAPVREQLDASMKTLEKLENEMAGVLKQITEAGQKVTELSSDGTSATSFIAVVVPDFFSSLMAQLVKGGGKRRDNGSITDRTRAQQIDELLKKRDAIGAQIDAEQKKAAALLLGDDPSRKAYDALAAKVAVALTDVNAVVCKLTKFNDVWAMIQHDLLELVESVKSMIEQPEKIKVEIIKNRVSTMKDFYKSICDVLLVFQSSVLKK